MNKSEVRGKLMSVVIKLDLVSLGMQMYAWCGCLSVTESVVSLTYVWAGGILTTIQSHTPASTGRCFIFCCQCMYFIL